VKKIIWKNGVLEVKCPCTKVQVEEAHGEEEPPQIAEYDDEADDEDDDEDAPREERSGARVIHQRHELVHKHFKELKAKALKDDCEKNPEKGIAASLWGAIAPLLMTPQEKEKLVEMLQKEARLKKMEEEPKRWEWTIGSPVELQRSTGAWVPARIGSYRDDVNGQSMKINGLEADDIMRIHYNNDGSQVGGSQVEWNSAGYYKDIRRGSYELRPVKAS